MRCAQFLFGERIWRVFVVLQVLTIIIGALLNTGAVWLFAETVNGLMAIPNLIALAYLSSQLRTLMEKDKEQGVFLAP